MKQLNKPLKSDEIISSFELFWVGFNQYTNDITKSFGQAHDLLDAL